MIAIYIIAAVLLLLTILLFIPVTAIITYSEKLTVVLRYAFFKFSVYPQKDKVKKKKKKEVEEKTKMKPKKEKKNVKELLRTGWVIFQASKHAFVKLFSHICVTGVEVNINVGGEDAAKIAINYAHINGIFYSFLALMQNFSTFGLKSVCIECGFLSEKTVYDIKGKIKVRPVFLLTALTRIIFTYIENILKSKNEDDDLMKKGA